MPSGCLSGGPFTSPRWRDTLSPLGTQSGDLDEMLHFVTVVDAGGFTAAASKLGARKALVSRRVKALERRLGAQLLVRTTRSVRVTELGARYYEKACPAIALAQDAERVVEANRVQPAGHLRVTTTELLASLLLRPVIPEFLHRHPQITVEVDVTSRHVDLIREGFDVALRVGAPDDSALTGVRLGAGRSVYVASPAFLSSKKAVPVHPRDLRDVAAVMVGRRASWSFARGHERIVIDPKPRLVTASYALGRDAVVAGLGVSRMPQFFVHEELRSGALRVLLEPWTPPVASIMAVYPGRELVVSKTRAFVAHLKRHVQKHPLKTR